jgi:hypothetical protein
MDGNLVLTNIDHGIIEKLEFEAGYRGVDLNTYVISILKKEVGHDYLGGILIGEETENYLKLSENFNRIDDALWD